VEYSSSARSHRFHLSAMPVASETLQLGFPVTSGNKTLSRKVQQVSEQPPNVSNDNEYAFSVNQINSVTENIAGNVGNVDLKILSILVRPVIL
jgi:hypothetical protein